MAKPQSKHKYIEVAVSWGGSELGRFQTSFANCSGVSAGRGLLNSIRSRVWPRWDDLEILTKSRSGLILNPNLPWDGVIDDGSDVHVLNASRPQKKIISISPTTTGTLRLEDMTIMIKVGPRNVGRNVKIVKRGGYAAGLLSLFADFRSDGMALFLGGLGSLIICGSIWWSLSNRPTETYKQITDLPQNKLSAFLAHSYLSSAPNMIQTGLDRFKFVRSVWSYYSDLGLVLGFGESANTGRQLFTSTKDYYKNLLSIQSSQLETSESHQQKKIAESLVRGPIISVPTVRGESLDGRVQRIFDKIAIVLDSSNELSKRRVDIAEKFAADIGYKFEARQEANSTQEAFAKISQGFLGIESDDIMQERAAKDAAAKAAAIQLKIYGKERLVFGTSQCCQPPAGMPLTQDGITWLKPDLSHVDGASLSELKASTWGSIDTKRGLSIGGTKAGQVDPASVEKTVRAGRYQLKLCYEMALRRNKTAGGAMEWRWTIGSDGRASDLNLIRSSIADDELVRCIRDKIASWRFPRPDGGTVEVKYPFEFSRDKG
jgi:hypothetical protein